MRKLRTNKVIFFSKMRVLGLNFEVCGASKVGRTFQERLAVLMHKMLRYGAQKMVQVIVPI